MATDTHPPVDARRDRASATPDAVATAAPGSVLAWVLRGQRRSLLLWSIAVATVSGIYASFYDVIEPGDMDALIDSMPEGLVAALGYDQLGSAAGFLESTVYSLLGPILLLVFGINLAARTLAGGEEDGSLELELTSAVGRRQVLLERYAALLVQIGVLVAVVTAVVIGLVVAIGMDVAVSGLLAGGLGLFLLVAALSSVAFAAGAVTGRRAVALGAGAGVAVVAYIANALAPLLDDGRWLEAISPFAWFLGGEPLVEGIDVVGFGGLATLAAVCLAAAVITFDRRDLGV
jgi:ABC-2 type transport system permease protein